MIYLDNAATTFPKPASVLERTWEYMTTRAGNPGRGAHYFSNASAEVIEQTRRQLAKFFQLPDFRRLVFTGGCTDSMNMVLKGHLKSGDHVIATNLDHNSASRPLEHLRETLPLQVTRVPFEKNGSIDPGLVQQAIRNNTTLIVLNHGSNVIGTVQPLAPFLEIVRESRIPILLDAAQTAGRIPIEVGDAPVFVTCSGHKGLYGMPGTGILTVPKGYELSKWREGGSGTASESLSHPTELPMRLEAGTPNFLGIASLSYGVDFIEQQGMFAIHNQEMKLAKSLESFVLSDHRFVLYSQLDAGRSVACVSFNIHNAPPVEVAAILDQRFGIAVRAGLHCAAVLHQQLGTAPEGCIRVSPGCLNTQQEMDQLFNALQEIANGYSG